MFVWVKWTSCFLAGTGSGIRKSSSASNPELSRCILAWSTSKFGIDRIIQTKVVLVWYGCVWHVPIEITVSLYGTVDKQREIPFFIPGSRCAIHTLISPDVDIFVRLTALSHPGFVSDDVKVFKRGSQLILIYGAICVVSASSSPVSRVISKPKEVRSFDEVGLPVRGIAIDSSVVIVKHRVFL